MFRTTADVLSMSLCFSICLSFLSLSLCLFLSVSIDIMALCSLGLGQKTQKLLV